MLKALVIKELRESAVVIALAALATLLMGTLYLPITLVTGGDSDSVPFVSDSFLWVFSLAASGLAIALGLKQTSGESRRDTFKFLLHRPATRRFIFGTKMAVGTAVLLTLGAMLILFYGMWAARPGNVAAPFYWSMTVVAWQLSFAFVIVYLGAFLSGIRPARWFGTRLMPLLAALLLTFQITFFPWWLAIVEVAILAALFVASILYYANVRDY